MKSSISTSLLFFLATASWGVASFAQESASAWPSKPVTFVLAVAPGAASEVETRLYTTKLAESLGKPFLMDFKPGAGGVVGVNHVAKAVPDGYTMLVATSSFTVTPALSGDAPYDIVRDFSAVSMMTFRPTMLVAYPGFPPNNLTEYIAYAKANPGKTLWATNGSGGSAHLGGVWLHTIINLPTTFVHYKGAGQVLADLLAGRVHVLQASPGSAMPNIRAGKLKILAVLSPKRLAQFPEVKTAEEQGIKDYRPASYLGIVATAGTPAPIVNKLNAELVKIAKMPDIIDKLTSDGALMVANTPGQFGEFIKTEYTRWVKLIKDNDIKEE